MIEQILVFPRYYLSIYFYRVFHTIMYNEDKQWKSLKALRMGDGCNCGSVENQRYTLHYLYLWVYVYIYGKRFLFLFLFLLISYKICMSLYKAKVSNAHSLSLPLLRYYAVYNVVAKFNNNSPWILVWWHDNFVINAL